MLYHTDRTIADAARVVEALQLEPSISLDLSHADLSTIAVVMFAAMWRGIDEADAIHAYLQQRGCRYDSEIDFLLSVYEGDDPHRHLWSRDENEGFYIPLLDPQPGELRVN